MTRRPPKILDFFEADDHRGTWTIREHSPSTSAQGWRRDGPAAKFVGTMLAWAALTFVVLLLWLH